MSGSTLTAFNYVAELSEATPGLFNAFLSVLSQNIAEANSIGTITSQISAVGMVTINANSNATDYFYLNDTSAQRSDYIIGSNAGGTADGLNIYDASGQTMIVSFSKQSVRFFQNVVGPVFDTGGALASTYNAATFGGSNKTTQIQAAILQASIDNVKRVYVPASMYPYFASQVSFINTVQMVREGGDWSVYDVFAYGGVGQGSDAAAIQAAVNGANTSNGVCYFPPATYNVATSIAVSSAVDLQLRGPGGNGALLSMAASGVTLLQFTGVCSRIIIRDLWLGSFNSYAAGGSIEVTGTAGTHSDSFLVENVTCQNTPNPIRLQYLDNSNFNNIRVFSSISSCVVGNAIYCNNVVSTVFHELYCDALSGHSFPSDVVVCGQDCDDVFFVNNQVFRGTGSGYRLLNDGGGTGPRLMRFTNAATESNTSAGFSIENVRGAHFSSCHAAVNHGPGYSISGGDGVQLYDSLAYQNDQEGIKVTGGHGVEIAGCIATNNGQTANNTYDGIAIYSGVSGVRIANNRSGDFFLVLTNKQRSGISVAASTDSIILVNNDTNGNATGGVNSASTGVHNSFWDTSMFTTDTNNSIILVPQLSGSTLSAANVVGSVRVFAGGNVPLATGFPGQSSVNLGALQSRTTDAITVYGTKVPTLLLHNDDTTSNNLNEIAFTTRNTSGTVVGTAAIASINGARTSGWGAGSLAFLTSQTAGIAEVMRLDSNGSLSIGTTTSAGALTVFGQSTFSVGVAKQPGIAFTSEQSLGLYRSGVSTIKLSYGQFSADSGSKATPGIGFSDTSLGFYKSGASTVALSYGGLGINAGANQSFGTAVLGSNGSVNVATTYVLTGDVIFLTDQTPGGTLGDIELGGIRNASGFTIQSTSVTDTSTVGWLIIRPV